MNRPSPVQAVLELAAALSLAAALAGCQDGGRAAIGSSALLCTQGDYACIACFEPFNASAAFCGAPDPAAYCADAAASKTRECEILIRCTRSGGRGIWCKPGGVLVWLICETCPYPERTQLAPFAADLAARDAAGGLLAQPTSLASPPGVAIDLGRGAVYAARQQADALLPSGAVITWNGAPAALVDADPGPPWELVAQFRPELLRQRLLENAARPDDFGDAGAREGGASKRGLTEFVAPGYPAFPSGIAAGPDGNLWITVPNHDQVVKLTPAGQATRFAVSQNELPLGIATGPDGSIWYTLARSARIATIHPTTGERRAFTIRDTSDPWPAAITPGPDGNLWFTEAHGNKIGRVTPAGTITQFDVPTADADPVGIVAGPDGNLWFTEMAAGKIGRITPAGSVTEFALASADAEPAFIAAGSDGNLWFTEMIGNAIGRITPAGAISRFPLPDAEVLPYGIGTGADGRLWFTELDGHRVGSITTAGVITYHTPPTSGSAPAQIVSGPDGAMWFTEQLGGKVGKVTAAGAVSELPLPLATSGPVDIVSGPDENLWFLEAAKSRLIRMSTSGAVSEFRIVGPERGEQPSPMTLTVGPDFNYWFTDNGIRVIGRATPAGAITLFALPAPAGSSLLPSPTGIVTGPDHALWFTDYWGSRIGRITLAGETSYFDIPKPGEWSASPLGITAGPDGNLWFTDDDNGVVSRMTTAGVVTHFTLPGGTSAAPHAITLGPDGNLWFAQRYANKIGRITPTGVITEFTVPTSGAEPIGITTGPDGNLWFTERNRGKVGRLTPAGVFTEISLPAADAQPLGITVGPDGALWFAENAASKIGRIDPNQLEPPTPPAGDWLTSAELPGFEVKVQVTTGSGAIAGQNEPACIADTLCVSGALAGRPEVFVRVVGPKPNGYLWPTLVKFSTSQIEIWVRRVSDEELRYYLLPAVDPGADLLNLAGLADRLGFAPATTSVAAAGRPAGVASPGAGAGVLPAASGPAPPAGDWLSTPELAGFRAKVRVTAGSTVIDGVQESACIAETLCVSGALAGRPEVFVRVVGPKPNGYLWPTLVKFSTSQIEIWIEQESTGTVQYYLLPAVDPGADLLDLAGLADKLGFAP